MIATTKPCCLWDNIAQAKTTVQLFSATGYKNRWASRIAALLLVQVDETDDLPSSVCKMCIRRLESLEKAAADLQGVSPKVHEHTPVTWSLEMYKGNQ